MRYARQQNAQPLSGSGSGGTGGGWHVDFSAATAFPLLLKTIESGSCLTICAIEILTVFDAGFSLSLGFPSDFNEVIASTDVKTFKAAIYEVFSGVKITSSRNLTLYSVGTSISGTGRVYVTEHYELT